MRINYKMMPTDYIEELQAKGKRRKARAFTEYYIDMSLDQVNSIGFYAQSWGVVTPMSKGTVHKWIGEFAEEISRFFGFLELKNKQHHNSVQKQSERQVNGKRTANPSTTPKKSTSKKELRTASERQVNEAINLDNNINARMRLRLGEDFFKIYRFNNGKYTGRKDEAIDAYMQIDDADHQQLLLALYSYRVSGEQMVGAAKFLRDKVYLDYMAMRIAVKIGKEWHKGEYDSKREVFTDDDGKDYRLTAETIVKKLGAGEIEFLLGVAA